MLSYALFSPVTVKVPREKRKQFPTMPGVSEDFLNIHPLQFLVAPSLVLSPRYLVP